MKFGKQAWPYLLFSVVLGIYAKNYYGQLFPADAVSYLSIAQKYASGHLGTAINAYWSPLVSWLIALQIKLGIPAIPAFYSIKLLSGLLIIFFSQKIIRCYQWPAWAQLACHTIVALWAAYYTLHHLTPDALMTAGLLLYLYGILSGKWLKHPLLTGLLGAGLYFTKAFGFYFFIAHVLLYIFWKLLSQRKQAFFILKKCGTMLLVSGCVSFLWLAALHHRYGSWQVSSAGSYNHNLMRYGNGSVQPALGSGLLALPDSSDYNSWEEITLVHTYADWKPWQSQQNAALQVQVIKDNGWFVLQHIYGSSRLLWVALGLGLAVACWYGFSFFIRKMKRTPFRLSTHILVFILLYACGYSAAGVDERYLYIVDVGLLFIAIDLLVWLSKTVPAFAILFYIITALLVLDCARGTIGKLQFFKNEISNQKQEVKGLQQIIPPGSIVATHATNAINAMDYWAGWHNHGGLVAYRNNDSALAALQLYKVQWVLIPDSVQQRYQWLLPYADTLQTCLRWQVYRLKTIHSIK